MNSITKRSISMVLALVMALTLACSAFAENQRADANVINGYVSELIYKYRDIIKDKIAAEVSQKNGKINVTGIDVNSFNFDINTGKLTTNFDIHLKYRYLKLFGKSHYIKFSSRLKTDGELRTTTDFTNVGYYTDVKFKFNYTTGGIVASILTGGTLNLVTSVVEGVVNNKLDAKTYWVNGDISDSQTYTQLNNYSLKNFVNGYVIPNYINPRIVGYSLFQMGDFGANVRSVECVDSDLNNGAVSVKMGIDFILNGNVYRVDAQSQFILFRDNVTKNWSIQPCIESITLVNSIPGLDLTFGLDGLKALMQNNIPPIPVPMP